jgi:dimethylaniline monooxygenase (N-oxide forming)
MTGPGPKRVVIIGAGWYGLAAAGTYRQINPTANIIIIDENSTIGGTWSEDRIYPTLVADSPCNGFEFSDLSMTESLGIPAWADIRGHDVYRYLQTWAAKHDLMRLCKFNTKVVEVSRTNGLWIISATGKDNPTEETILCEKLIVASGLSSKPNIPTMPINFNGMTLHSKQLGKNLLALVHDTCRQVIVVGGHKSAVEIVQICAFAGKKVTWLIREEGNGPSLLMNARLKGNHTFAQAWRRVGSIFKPGAYARRDFWYQFLQSGRCAFGFWLMQWAMRKQTIKLVGDRYSSSENGKRLKPQADRYFAMH